jgi:four helix bundle protein
VTGHGTFYESIKVHGSKFKVGWDALFVKFSGTMGVPGSSVVATIRKFEDVESWKQARQLARMIYACSDKGGFTRDFGLKNQIRRATVSIMSNIAEGFGRGGNKEFIQFLSTARGSVSEVQSQLYVALDVGYITADEFEKLYSQSTTTSNTISGFIRYLCNSSLKGTKYKTP